MRGFHIKRLTVRLQGSCKPIVQSQISLQKRIKIKITSKEKIRALYFDVIVITTRYKKNVFRLKISVYDFLRMQVGQGIHYLNHNKTTTIFGEFSLATQAIK